MKKLLFVFISLCFLAKVQAQSMDLSPSDTLPKFYLGVSTGLNNVNALLGVNAVIRVHDKLFLRGGIGAGAWGNKYTIGIRYDKQYRGGWSYNLGYSICPGIKDVKVNMEVESKTTKDVTLDYLSTSTVNLSMAYNWPIKTASAFYLEFGYAFALESEPWKVQGSDVLSTNSISALNILRPGGVILGLGFSFGL